MDRTGSPMQRQARFEPSVESPLESPARKVVPLDPRFVPDQDYTINRLQICFKITKLTSYMVEFGNTSFLSAVQNSFSLESDAHSSIQLQASEIQGEFNKTCCVLAIVCDENGELRHVEKLALTGKRVVKLPVSAERTRICFSLRLSGEGTFRSIDIVARHSDSNRSEVIQLVPQTRRSGEGALSTTVWQRPIRRLLARVEQRHLPARWAEWAEKIRTIRAIHYYRKNAELRLARPVLFSEKMQWRKLFDANPLYTRLSDKAGVRSYIEEHGFADLLIPVLWLGNDPARIPLEELPRPFILKSTHASGHVIIVRSGEAIDRHAVETRTQAWLDTCLGTTGTAPGYLRVPHQLIVEPLLRDRDGEPPIELKVFVFNGKVKFLQYVRTLPDRTHQVAYRTADWQDLGWRGRSPPFDVEPPRTAAVDRSFQVAEALCRDLDHCRVDFYIRDGRLFIGEMTLYSWAGWPKIRSRDADAIMGSFWTLRWPLARAAYAVLFKRWGR